MQFPNYLWMSKNYFDPSWSLKTHRRLKNIIVLLDVAPSLSGLSDIVDPGKSLTKSQEKSLRKAFDFADSGSSGGLHFGELKEVLKAVDVNESDEEGKKLINSLLNGQPPDPKRLITFDEVKNVLSKRTYYKIQQGRFYVALSLFEAECMRAAMHIKHGSPFLTEKDTILSLRTTSLSIDSSYRYQPAGQFQDTTASSCYRFIDNQDNFQPKEISVLLRALQENECKLRRKFYIEVRSNRRRKERDPSQTTLSKLFVTTDEHYLLQYKIATGKVRALLKTQGMYARDAFAAFDFDRDGLLNFEELRSGLDWLGLKMSPILVKEIITTLDEDKDGYINLAEFKEAVGWDEEKEDSDAVGQYTGAPMMMPRMINAGDPNSVTVNIPKEVLAAIKIKVKKVTKFNSIWTSQGSMSRVKGSIWQPVTDGLSSMRQNKVTCSLGHYAGTNYDNPSRDSRDRLTLEVTDTKGNWVGGSSWLEHVLNKYLPHPARFRLVWSQTQGNNQFYAWEPVPPSDKFVSLGMIGTTKKDPPKLTSMRCIARELVYECNSNVKRVWNTEGTVGKQGSIWNLNKFCLIGFVAGHDPPRQSLYEVRSERFFLKDYINIEKSSDTSSYMPASAK